MSPKGSKRRKGKEVVPTPKPQIKEEKGVVSRKWYVLLAVVGVITLVSYLNCLDNQFVFDDIHVILKNPSIRGIEKIPRLLGVGKWRVSYRPIRMVSYAVDYTLNVKLWRHVEGYEGSDPGLNPLGYHMSNLFYHMLTSFLVFLVVYRLVANYRVAFLAASLFALHPVHTDSVTYLSGRRDILFTLFYLAGFYFFLRYRQTKKITFILAAFLSYLLSLGSKEMAVTFPAVFLCYDLVEDFASRAGRENRGYFKELTLTLKKVILQSKYLYLTTFLGALAYSYYKIFIKSPSFQDYHYGNSMLTTFLTMGKILVHYIRLLLYPIRLNADYYYDAFPLSSSFLEPATFFSFIFLGVVGYAVLRLLVAHPMLAFGGIWFFVTLLPVCQIFPHHELLAEHYLYLPSFGFCLVSAVLINSFVEEKRYRYIICAAFAAIIFLFSIRIADRNRDWKDGLTLWEKTVKTAPRCARTRNNLGLAYVEDKRLDEAIVEYKRALTIKPNFAQAHDNLGIAYAKKGRFEDAISEYRKAIAIKPDQAEAYSNLGNVYNKQGRLDEAISEYKKALVIKPRFAVVHSNLGVAYAKKGRLDEAISEQIKALWINPNLEEAHTNLGVVYHQKDDLDKAIYSYEQALAINPNLAWVHSNLAAIYLKKRQYPLAIKHCDRAIELGFKVNTKLLKGLLPYR